ncbi:hypothetical protein TcasGA2_TC011581 [Tribolium castaneum]|uniref:Uncharacterized protein n=1 Tax=Tribolium castaneum TaxID=7070 RepID=D7GYF4_TRICA|nr:hypothetical protein TcasGA2_TC011581 [Tribolium castaneum]
MAEQMECKFQRQMDAASYSKYKTVDRKKEECGSGKFLLDTISLRTRELPMLFEENASSRK